ncbi:type II toxin-antitoxin system RelE/ParE family toxin [bacterium]|nr:type II toxin-antitoxin system RelE/ParE family toxin [bacterium]
MIAIWNREAEDEFFDAAGYYERQDEGLGERFVIHIRATVTRVCENPFMAHCFDDDCRKVKTDKFPYVVIYYVEGELIQITSIMHTSRHPDSWKSRLQNG